MLSQAIHCATRDTPIEIEFDSEKADEKERIEKTNEIIVSCAVKFDKEKK